MKNWLRNKIRNFLEAPNDQTGKLSLIELSPQTPGNSLSSHNDPLQFTVYEAAGGRVVEVRYYNHKRDSMETRLHIITSDEDFGKSISEILMLENISR